MTDEQAPKYPSAKSKKGDRWESDSETVERYDRAAAGGADGAGISNRSDEEEIEEQGSLPRRGEAKEGVNAGRGRNGPEDEQ